VVRVGATSGSKPESVVKVAHSRSARPDEGLTAPAFLARNDAVSRSVSGSGAASPTSDDANGCGGDRNPSEEEPDTRSGPVRPDARVDSLTLALAGVDQGLHSSRFGRMKPDERLPAARFDPVKPNEGAV
jgi:hypothetical protein